MARGPQRVRPNGRPFRSYPPEVIGGDAPAWLPAGAVAYADYVNGHYWAGTELAPVQFLADPSKITGGRLAVPLGEIVDYTGAFLATLLGQSWTAVVEFDFGDETAGGYLLYVRDNADNFAVSLRAYGFAGTEPGNVERAATPLTNPPEGVARIAVSYSTSRLVFSRNGAAVIADETDAGFLETAAVMHAAWSAPVSIRSVTVYPLLPDADLPVLSALS